MARSPASRIDPDLQRLFADVLASPEDDTPRLVLADALMERGDPRGELIAIQCAQTEADDAVDRVDALLDRYAGRWTEGLGPKVISYGFRRGFVEEVRGPSEVLSRYLPKLARVTPIRRVVVSKLDAQSEEAFVAALVETGVRALTLDAATPELVAAFAKSALPRTLEELHLGRNGEAMLACSWASLRRLSFPTYFGEGVSTLLSLDAPLEHLELTGAYGLRELSRTKFRDTLRSLVISGANLDLLADLQLPNLDTVDVGNTRVDDDAMTAFERAPAPLRRLSAAHAVHGDLLRRLLSAIPKIEALDLSRCGGANLVTAADLPRLTELRVRGTDVDIHDLLRSPHRARLRLLDLEDDEVGDDGALAIAKEGFPELRVLDLRDTDIGAVGAAALASSAALPLLRDLDLTGNAIGEDGALALANGSGLQRLSRLALHEVKVGNKGGRALKARFGGVLEKHSGS